ncbi:MAG: DUF1223 domain-containing protein [Gammaproteobacteria bacterium]
MKKHITGLFLVMITHTAVAQDILLQTGDIQNSIIELYTSQGCNSCPPAEHLLNSYKQKTNLWRNVIPMAFHVDYWDYLGWKDRFAQATFGTRQRQYASMQHRATVYTPAFIVNGKNWRPGLFSNTPPVNTNNITGKLKVRINQQIIRASFLPIQTINQPLYLNLALLGMGLKTQIKAGENAGRLSRHEFVVLQHKRFIGQSTRWKINWPFNNFHQAPQYAMAAWITIGDSLTPLQASGTYLPGDFIQNKK